MQPSHLCVTTKMFLAALAVATMLACSTGDGPNAPQEAKAPLPAATPTAKSAIRLVDFDNIAYPNFPEYSNTKEKRITLERGEAAPSHVNYGDVTGDGAEEALVAVPVEIRGSAIPHHVYIFTIENGKPKLLWDFDTGDRSDGGLRQLYADNGQLVIELYGKDRVVSSELYKGDEALCCPSSFTGARYTWTGTSFEHASKQVLENPARNANPTMPVYR